MSELSEELLYEGITVDIGFDPPGPRFGDLVQICGYDNPSFPPSSSYSFDTLVDLQFSQVDDYFGVRSLGEDGDDVIVWLYPLVDFEPVYHHEGPFDGVRLQFSVLRNPSSRVDHFLRCVSAIAALSERPPPNLDAIRANIDAVTQYWRRKGIEVGSDAALEIDY